MQRPRSSVVVLTLVDAVVVLAGVLVAVTRAGSDRVAFLATGPDRAPTPTAAPAPPRPRPVSPDDVRSRPAPERVLAKGRWGATLEARADRLRIFAPVVAVDGVRHTTVELISADPRPQTAADGSVRHPAGTALALPDGSRWYPLEPFAVDGPGNVALNGPSTSGGQLTGATPLAGLLGRNGVEATGRFVTRDGRETNGLRLPAGTRVSSDCAGPDPAQAPAPCAGASTSTTVEVTVDGAGVRVEIDDSRLPGYDGNGEGAVEVEVAGSVRARALGREWTGLVGSLEANDVEGTAVWDGVAWDVEVTARSARQVWIDVWPVVDTVLRATSGYDGGLHSCAGDCSVRLRYENVGYATAQILEAEALGGTNSVALGLNRTGTHDAGVGVHRGGGEVNLRDGRGVDSHLPPGDYHDRGLSTTTGVPVTLALRGNFAEVRVPLAIPAGAPDPR